LVYERLAGGDGLAGDTQRGLRFNRAEENLIAARTMSSRLAATSAWRAFSVSFCEAIRLRVRPKSVSNWLS